MARLEDPLRLRAYCNALGNWQFRDFVRWTKQAESWVRRELGDRPRKELARLMWEYVRDGGEIDAVRETRPEWSEHEYHYDLRFSIDGMPVYFETRLFFDDPDDPDDPWIHVVNVHDP